MKEIFISLGLRIRLTILLLLSSKSKPFHWVFSPSRSGTISLGATLRKISPLVVETHFVGNISQKNHWRNMYYPGTTLVKGRPRFLFPFLKLTKRCIYFYTSVRDPVARELSIFTNMMMAYLPEFMERDLKSIYDFFHETHTFSSYRSVNWFDDSFYPELDVDVYSFPFNKEAGYGKVLNGKYPVFIVKSEAILDPIRRSGIAKELSNFAGEPIMDMVTSCWNDAKYRYYYPRYREIVDNFIADDAYLDRVYNSKYMKHFYTDEEIASFRAKWKHQPVENITPPPSHTRNV